MSNINNFRRSSLVLLLLSVGIAAEVRAEKSDKPIRITLHPMAEPTPALKHRLLPEFIDRKPGNAAVFYGKVTAEQFNYFGSSGKEISDKINRWAETPLQELLDEGARVPFDTHFLRKAALCESCDWQLPVREGRLFALLLPEVQQTREFQRILSAEARIHIANGEFKEAIESFQTSFAFASNVAEGETFVNGLVGIAIANITMNQMTTFVQQPNAPNLYWALSVLPKPYFDFRDALDTELSAFSLSFPEYQDLESDSRSPQEWDDLLYAYCEYIAAWDENDQLGNADQLHLEILEGYEQCKQALIDQGRAVADVEAMPKEQVVALHGIMAFREFQQEIAKYYHLPYPVAIERIEAAMKLPTHVPAQIAGQCENFRRVLTSTRTAIARNIRKTEVLRILEALRIHAAANGGKLPADLKEITEVPIPLNPITGKPFEYQLKGKTAFLTGATIHNAPLNYEITMQTKVD